MNEGDLAIVFSQFGEISDVHIRRDPKTGKSLGFAFIAFENQLSSVLAVDNMNATLLCGRPISVDHVKEFKPPRPEIKAKEDGAESSSEDIEGKLYKPSGPDGNGWGDFRKLTE